MPSGIMIAPAQKSTVCSSWALLPLIGETPEPRPAPARGRLLVPAPIRLPEARSGWVDELVGAVV